MIATGPTASYLLGQKLDSIPFSPYHVVLIVVLGIVGFVEGYDLALGGSLIVLAKGTIGLSPKDVRWLVAARRSWSSLVAMRPQRCPTV